MPYTSQSKDLPSYVKNRTSAIKKKWVAIFNRVYAEEGEKMAFLVANKWLKRQVKEKKSVARTSQVRERVTFVIDDSTELIKRTEDGDDYVSFKLADVFKDKYGVQLNKNILQRWANSINNGLTVLGDVDHEYYDKLLESGYTDNEVKELIKNKPSIAKALKAVVDKGRLWVRAIIDKRYKNIVQKSRGVSMEAIVTRDDKGNVVDGDLLGFTFAVKHDPVIPGTGVEA
jgi:hypothetical protein